MADSPDLSKIVSVIMEHPEIVGQIASLLTSEGEEKDVPTSVEPSESTEVSTPPMPKRGNSNRARLLGAMKPYLSTNRAQAVDTMITVSEILESMRRGG